MIEIRTADLCFDLDETSAFFQQTVGQELDPETVALLQKRTEGWIAGLHSRGAVPRDISDPAEYVKSFAGNNNQYVMDFLIGEVLSRQSQSMQQFLLQTSLLDRFCAELCQTVTGLDSISAVESILREMDQANLFLIPMDDQRKWYRYHHLFHDLLQHRLHQQSSAEQIRALHLNASRWYAQEDFVEEAVHHALAADAVDEACRLVGDRLNGALDREAWNEIERWLLLLPEQEIQRHAGLFIASVWVQHFRGAFQAIPPLLTRAQTLMERNDEGLDETLLQMLWAHLDALDAEILFFGSKPVAAIEYADRGMTRVTTSTRFCTAGCA